MKKRVLAMVLGLTMLVSIFAVGCTKDEAKADFKAGFVYIGPTNDNGWTTAHDVARLELEKQLGIETAYVELVAEDEAAVKDAVTNLIDVGCNIIFTTSFGYMEPTVALAAEYPDLYFLHCSGYMMSENLGTYFGRIYEPRFLSGIVAGMKTTSNEIGYVAAMNIPEVVRGINAFTLGVKMVNPDATVNVRWTNTWIDPAKAKEAAEALLAEGCDVITQHQDSPGPLIAAEEKGAFAIGYDYPLTDVAPGSYMTAPVFNWSVYYVDIVKQIMDGKFVSASYWEGLNSGVVALAPMTDLVPAEAKTLVNEYEAKIKDGSFFVFEGEIKDNTGAVKVPAGTKMTDGEMLSMDWFVEGVKSN
ncbi:MAG: BMP family ABC transporter substrate-binding protein [Clostridia bacterium]|nr:BMP family ABC transporter substrate-binding protein [Clostridia bacterium]